MSLWLNMHKLVYWCAGGLVVANTLPHLLPAYSRMSCELASASAPEELVGHVRKIAHGMGLANPERIQVFISAGSSSVSGGSTKLPAGSIVGLPRAVLFQGPEDVMRAKATLRGEAVCWESNEGCALLKLLQPSTDVINFRIAHELAHLKHHDWLWAMALSPLVLVAGYHLAVFLSRSVFAAHLQLAFPILFSMTVFAFVETKRIINHWQEFRADRVAALCSRRYAEGGVEFFRNSMQMDALAG